MPQLPRMASNLASLRARPFCTIAALLFLVLVSLPHPSHAASPVATPSKTRNPVLLIHGIKDSAVRMERLARYLRSQGTEAHTMSLVPSWGQKGLDELAEQVAAFA